MTQHMAKKAYIGQWIGQGGAVYAEIPIGRGAVRPAAQQQRRQRQQRKAQDHRRVEPDHNASFQWKFLFSNRGTIE